MTQVIIKQIPIGPMMNYAYLIGDNETKTAAAVDPAWDAQAIIRTAEDEDWKITSILLTHSHFDHVSAVEALAKIVDARIFVHRADAKDLPSGLPIHPTEEGTVIDVGYIHIHCLHTPGHTPGSQCFLVDGSLITGDTLFIDGCGRVDLPGSNPEDMLASLKRLSSLDPKTVIYPGHGYGPSPTATIGEQLKTNPYLNAKSETILL